MSDTTGTIDRGEQIGIGRGNVQQSVTVTNADLMVQLHLVRAEMDSLKTSILTINTTRDRLWFAIICVFAILVMAFYSLDRSASVNEQDIRDLERKVELLERRVSLVD
jgi:hypothetical protein